MQKNTFNSIDLNSPERFVEIHSILEKKAALRALYTEVYQKYANSIMHCPSEGMIVEIGSGAGFVKDIIPHIITSDVVSYPNIDRVMDATHLDFPDNSLSCICLFNVLHHISNTPAFFKEATRCLLPGGRVIMMEPYAGWISSWIYRFIHHEDFDKDVKNWEFESNGPVSDANNALPYVIFVRDLKRFQTEFPALSLIRFEPHMPLRYWLTGGLKKWSLLPVWAYDFAAWLDRKICQISPRFGSFVDIELMKKPY